MGSQYPGPPVPFFSAPPSNGSTFLAILPAEVRNRVYEEFIREFPPIRYHISNICRHQNRTSEITRLLAVNRQLNDEAGYIARRDMTLVIQNSTCSHCFTAGSFSIPTRISRLGFETPVSAFSGLFPALQQTYAGRGRLLENITARHDWDYAGGFGTGPQITFTQELSHGMLPFIRFTLQHATTISLKFRVRQQQQLNQPPAQPRYVRIVFDVNRNVTLEGSTMVLVDGVRGQLLALINFPSGTRVVSVGTMPNRVEQVMVVP